MSITTIVAVIIILLTLSGAGIYAHHRGYTAGQAQRDSYYAIMIRSATLAQQAAEARAGKLQADSEDITTNIEKQHEQVETTLAAQASTAQSRIADLLRQRAPACAAAHSAMPSIPASPSGTAASPPGEQRTERLAADLTELAKRCESDAIKLNQFQEWYRAEQTAHQVK
jgi:hypothetical protein